MRGEVHVRFGGRAGETHRAKADRALRSDPYTEIKTWEGKLYLATVIDLYSRRLIGFAIAEHCKASLVCDALRMAIATRGGQIAGVIMHTDPGSQYTAASFVEMCRKHGIVQSMSGSDRFENVVAESFFVTLKTRLPQVLLK